MYQLAKKQDTTVENTTNINISNVYLDLNNDHIHKAQLIANYLTQAYKQLNLDNTQINNQISSLNSLIQTLDSYKYGDTIPSSIANFLSSSSLNISSDDNHLPLDNQIEFLVKSLDINGQTQTFVAPMYVFSSTDKKFPIPSLTFTINDDNFNEDYDVTPASQVKGTVRVPIFMYHQITQAPAGQNSFQTGLYVDPSDLEKEMAYLVKKNYKSITPLEYYNLLMSGENPTQKTVMITFDDGVENQYTNAYPILKKYDLTGVFYIIAQRSAITAAQSKEMSDNGMVIDSHSSTHVDLTKVTDPTQLSYEVISSKYALQTTTGKTVYSFAYPGCGWNSETVSYVTSAGYLLGMSCGSTIDNYPQYRLELSRVHAFGDMQSFKNLLSNVH
jgi:peptidoglycan/xylan/chitin deacetylase (PgdA/CDA1 family)